MKDYSFIVGNRNQVVEGDILWTVSYSTNSVLRIDLKRRELIDAYPIPDGNVGIVQGHIGIKKRENIIYILPYNGKNIYCFNTKNSEFESIILEDNIHIVANVIYGQYLYMIDENGKGIFCIDCENKTIEKKVFTDKEKELYGLEKEDRVFMFSCQKDDKLYVTLFARNKVLVLDLVNNLYEFVTMPGDKNIKLASIDEFQDGFILSTLNEELITWKPDGVNKVECLHFLGGDSRKQQRNYWKIFSVGQELVLIPPWERKIIMKKSQEYINMNFHYFSCEEYPEYSMMQFMMAFEYDGKYYIQAVSNGQMYCIDIAEKKIEAIEMLIPDLIRKRVVKEMFHNNNRAVFNENGIIHLNDYVEFFIEE